MQILKKVFSFCSKILFEQEIERNINCVYCGTKLRSNQRRFCNSKCNNAYWRNTYSNKRSRLRNLISNERRENKNE